MAGMAPPAAPDDEAPSPPRFDDAHVHLVVLGRKVVLDERVPVGPTAPRSALTLARTLGAAIDREVDEHERAAGRAPSCREGCASCCRQLVPVATLEAARLAELVSELPEPRRAEVRERFAHVVARMEERGLVEAPAEGRARVALLLDVDDDELDAAARWEKVSRRYYAERLDCPFLEDERCSIYAERPLACREYRVISPPELCAELSPGLQAVPRPVFGAEALEHATDQALGRSATLVPLPLALEWAARHAGELERPVDGERLFVALTTAIALQQAPATSAADAPNGPPRGAKKARKWVRRRR
jgi:Fe-S-cluster containining protein